MTANIGDVPPAASASKPFHTVIIGAGITGITLAIALHKRDIPFTLYDQSQNFTEIGAGIAFSPNAVRAMEACDPRIREGLNKVAMGNLWKEKEAVYFAFLDGYTRTEGKEDLMFSIDRTGSPGEKARGIGCHRAQFLEEMVKLVPSGSAKFGKRLTGIDEVAVGEGVDDKRLKVNFQDGSSEWTDCVVGCDGIKSRSGPEGHILTFPVAKGKLMNVVAVSKVEGANRSVMSYVPSLKFASQFRDDSRPWPDESRLTLPSKKADAIEAFAGWNPTVNKITDMLLGNLDRWGIFDTYDYPASTYHTGCLCIVGDAAHASSPHHGAGAGACIEDAAVLAEVLLEAKHIAQNNNGIEVSVLLESALAAYEAVRLEPTQWLVASSRKAGNIYDWMDPNCGRDPARMKEELLWRHHKIWHADITAMIEESKQDLRRRL
ncbi:MAG: hypothetical protein M1828_004238 [Chrysothrix sp. TS-e1954]|nr:MAG: hypothetical protein M1828_004238 [Chrysothrix sp. TS-e1954]